MGRVGGMVWKMRFYKRETIAAIIYEIMSFITHLSSIYATQIINSFLNLRNSANHDTYQWRDFQQMVKSIIFYCKISFGMMVIQYNIHCIFIVEMQYLWLFSVKVCISQARSIKSNARNILINVQRKPKKELEKNLKTFNILL